MRILIRPAEARDCNALTRIVRESSAYQGEYRRMVENITFTPEHIARDVAFVAEVNERVAGFYTLLVSPDEAELDFLFVDGLFRGQGLGQSLFQHMRDQASQLGYRTVKIVSHPPAAAFYQRMGAIKVDVLPPKGRITWSQPLMIVEVK